MSVRNSNHPAVRVQQDDLGKLLRDRCLCVLGEVADEVADAEAGLHVMEINGGDGGEGCGLCAEAGGAEMDRDEAERQGQFGFGVGKIAFRTDQDDDFRTIGTFEHLLDAPARNVLIFKAIGDQTQRLDGRIFWLAGSTMCKNEILD